ncbi:MAG TPA: RHS repeat-associated core domain-containing protein [Pseudonocardiaceae bacterium]|jgi:RHS repeat-associated protein
MTLIDGRAGGFGLAGLRTAARRRRHQGIVFGVALSLFLSILAVFAPPSLASPARTAPPAAQQVPSVPVHPVAGHYQKPAPMTQWRPGKVNWPSGSATVTLSTVAKSNATTAAPTPAQAGALPVWIAPATQHTAAQTATPVTPASVAVNVAPKTAANALGVDGVVLSVARADHATQSGAVAVTLGYGSFRDAFGGDWASRLHLVQFPACALTTPAKAGCDTSTPVAYTRDDKANSLTANITLAGAAPAVLAATSGSGSGSGSGNFSATTLKASGSWTAGGGADGFDYSYPITLPQVPGSLVPPVTLSYDSQSLDGLTSSTNNQASWIGDGWEYTPGYIQRGFGSCNDNPAGTTKTQDVCWSQNNTLNLYLDGQSTQLVYDATTKTYHAQQDQNDRVQYETGAQNGAQNGEYFIVTTTDGTKYYFGLNQLPGFGSGSAATNSVNTEPVFATASGQPCYNATFANSWCQQAYQWNLDYVVDAHSDAVSYFYNTETNYYARDNGKTADTSYIRGSYLARVQYGQRDGQVYSTKPGAQVVFTSTGRCNQSTCDPSTLSKTTATNWPDVPYDLNCADKAACQVQSPSFWSEYALQTIQTQALVGSTETNVDSWSLTHTLPDPGDTTPTGATSTPALWLSSITHTGQDTSAGGSTSAIGLPTVTFKGQALANRVNLTNGYPPITRFRLQEIDTETGEKITVDYSSAACSGGTPGDASTNGSLCYPDYWTPDGAVNPMLDWFNKYIVSAVLQEDPTGGSANDTVQTTYTPVGAPAWHYNDNPLTLAAQRTWDQWRGYAGMIVSVGTAPDPVQKTQYAYLRGMDGDTLPNNGVRSAKVSDSRGGSVADANQFDGMTYETIAYNGSAVVTDTIDTPWSSAATASQPISGLPALQSFLTGTGESRVYTPLANGSTRESDKVTTHDADGRVSTVSDRADVAVPAEDTCTTTTYADNTTAWILDKTADVSEVSVNCSAKAALPADAVSDKRTFYDGSTTIGAAPTKGDATMTTQATSYTGSTPNFSTMSTTTPDEYGRATGATDADGRLTQTAYAPDAGAAPTQITTTDPMGHITVVTQDPLRGLPETSTDAGGFVTTQQYDALGRLTAVYKPGEPVGQPPNLKYSYTISSTAPSIIDSYSLDGDGSYREVETLYDALLRERETQTQTPYNPATSSYGRDITDTIYNTDGLESVSTDQYFNASPIAPTLVQAQVGDVPSEVGTTYDSDGRKTVETTYAHGIQTWQTSYSYGGDFTTTVPPSGEVATTKITDGRGRQTDLIQYHAGVPADPVSDPASDYSDTRTTYFPNDKEASVVDAAGNTWSYQYNLLDQQTVTNDPDSGTTTNGYDNAGQLMSTTDARGKQTSTTHDLDGRKTASYDTTGGAAENASDEIASWGWDTAPGPNGPAVGYAASTTSISNGDTYTDTIDSYDPLAKPGKTTDKLTGTDAALVPSAGYDTSLVYDIAGNLITQKDPAAGGLKAESINTTYDQFGEPIALNSTSIGAQSIYVSSVGYNPYGNPVQYTLPATGGNVWLNLKYDEQTQKLTEAVTTDSSTTAVVDDLNYGYQNTAVSKGANLITSITDKQNSSAVVDTQCFAYDYATRLSAAWTATDSCAATPAPGNSGTVGGANPYWQSWSYDAAGDRAGQVDHDTTGNTAQDTSTTYDYPAPGSATDQPNTLSDTTSTGPNATANTVSYHYDASGDTTQIGGGSLGNQTLTYNDQGKLSSDTVAAGTVGYVYDADDNLLVRRDPGTTTLFMGDMQLALNTKTGAITGTRYYTIGKETIATRTAGVNSGNTQYLIPDRQGTDQLIIDSATQTVTRRQYLPFGNVRGSAPSAWDGGDKGYVGGLPDDTTGLENLGAREYDAASGRFITDDPVFEADDPIEIGGYDYAGNDPVTQSDPTGECFLGCFWQPAFHAVANVVHTVVKHVITPVVNFVNNNRTAILGGLAIVTAWCPPLSIGLGVAAAVSSGFDAYHDFKKGDWQAGLLDIGGGLASLAGAGWAFKGARAAYEAGKATDEALEAAAKARSLYGKVGSKALRQRTWRQANKILDERIEPWRRVSDIFNKRSWGATLYGIGGTAAWYVEQNRAPSYGRVHAI